MLAVPWLIRNRLARSCKAHLCLINLKLQVKWDVSARPLTIVQAAACWRINEELLRIPELRFTWLICRISQGLFAIEDLGRICSTAAVSDLSWATYCSKQQALCVKLLGLTCLTKIHKLGNTSGNLGVSIEIVTVLGPCPLPEFWTFGVFHNKFHWHKRVQTLHRFLNSSSAFSKDINLTT